MKFEIGNKAAEKWTEENALELFEKMRDNTLKDAEIFTIDGAILEAGIYASTFYHLLKKFPVLESIKKDLEGILLARIGKGGLKGDLNPAMCIWKSKQLGEKDQQYQEVKQENTNTEIKVKII